MLVAYGKADVGVTFVVIAFVVLALIGLAHFIRGRM